MVRHKEEEKKAINFQCAAFSNGASTFAATDCRRDTIQDILSAYNYFWE